MIETVAKTRKASNVGNSFSGERPRLTVNQDQRHRIRRINRRFKQIQVHKSIIMQLMVTALLLSKRRASKKKIKAIKLFQ